MAEGPSVRGAVEHIIDRVHDITGRPFATLVPDLVPDLAETVGGTNKGLGRTILHDLLPELRDVERRFALIARSLPVGLDKRPIWPTKIVGIDFEKGFASRSTGAPLA